MGQNVELVNASVASDCHELFHCVYCTLLLVDPYQLTCGHRICCNCMDREKGKPITCTKCGELTRHEQCHKDKACSKEIQELLVRCTSRGCEWTGKYSESQKHEEECDHMVEYCDYCGRQLTKLEMREHLNVNNYDGCSQLHQPCVFKSLGCNFKGTTYQLDRHEHSERNYHYHLINCVCEHVEVPLIYV